MRRWLVGTLLVTACGGRALDDGPSSAGAGTTAGSPGAGGSAGAAGLGFAGRNPAGGSPSIGGAPGVAGAAGSSIGEACAAYCKSFLSGACANMLSTNCQTECTTELSDPPACQAPAKALMQCLAPIYEVGGGIDCQALQQAGEAVCRSQYDAYTGCEGSVITEPDSCTGGGFSDAVSCVFDLKCESGNFYSVSCKSVDPKRSVCFCASSTSSANFDVFETSTKACDAAANTCGFPPHSPTPGL